MALGWRILGGGVRRAAYTRRASTSKVMENLDYKFTNNWFDGNKNTWSQLLNQLNPVKILEVGSYEGKSTTYLIDHLGNQTGIDIHCVDSWEGGIEHKDLQMAEVEARFHHNIKIAQNIATNKANIIIHKGLSSRELPKLIAQGMQQYFDFIYIDGSHQAPDVLLDSVLGFELLRVNGIIAFDDYLWQEPLPGGTDPIRCPKAAIDTFANIYCRKLRIIPAPLYQLYAQKISQ
jgi:predicted O-methyltransferase YrrM